LIVLILIDGFGTRKSVIVAANFACNANASEVVDPTVDAEDTGAVVVVADAIAVVREPTVLVVTAAKLESVGLVAVISGVYVVAVSCGIGAVALAFAPRLWNCAWQCRRARARSLFLGGTKRFRRDERKIRGVSN